VFPAGARDQIMLVTNTGMVIRVPIEGISIKRRRTQGMVVFKVEEGERVVSVAPLPSENGVNGAAEEDGGEMPQQGESA
jgi:DNA gyrase subunit A